MTASTNEGKTKETQIETLTKEMTDKKDEIIRLEKAKTDLTCVKDQLNKQITTMKTDFEA